MDQGLATLLAASLAGIAGVAGALLGVLIESRRADSRAKEDRDFQQRLLQEQADREDDRRRELWAREERLAAEDRIRSLRIATLDSSRDFYLAVFNWMEDIAWGERPNSEEPSVTQYPDADKRLLANAALYDELNRLTAICHSHDLATIQLEQGAIRDARDKARRMLYNQRLLVMDGKDFLLAAPDQASESRPLTPGPAS
jgi:hypothetical protein